MANTYFQFKQFTIHQDHCAMKVTTDGCLFGAYAAHWSLSNWVNKLLKEDYLNILDIGSGTGLLSLMTAQTNSTAIIDAIEIDPNAAKQSKENFNASPWKNNLQVHQLSIQDFIFSNIKKYDLIISNPPFYEQQLKGDNQLKNTAHHSEDLPLNELFVCVNKLINANGYFIVLLPFYRTNEAIKIAETNHLFLQQKVLVKQTPKHNYFRSILIFNGTKIENIIEEIITIKDDKNQYTPRFQQLLEAYYLKC